MHYNLGAVMETYIRNYQLHPNARMSINNVTCQSTSFPTRFVRDCSYNVDNTSCATFTIGCYIGEQHIWCKTNA